jgi:predicted DNA-binding WGR domain protein
MKPKSVELHINDRVQLSGDYNWWVVTKIVSPTEIQGAREHGTHITKGKSSRIDVRKIAAIRHVDPRSQRTVWCVMQNTKSSKFWTLREYDNYLTTTWGRLGYPGQVTVKQYGSPNERTLAADLLLAEKINKGYKVIATASHLSEDEAGVQVRRV